MKTLKQYSEAVNSALATLPQLKGEPDGLYAPIRYTLEGGGKRLRPVLTLAVADALGMDSDKVMPAALAMEVYHNFTLLHDDIMDRSDTRRGRPTVWTRWDEATAILSGDAMLTIASELVTEARVEAARLLAMTVLFNQVAMDVYRGQQYDMDFEKRADVTVDEYMSMISLKTSALLAGSCCMGAVAAGAEPHILDLLNDYGQLIGRAFQLQDDLLDSFGDAATFGKPIGGDIINDKKTWLNITARSEAPETMAEASRLSGQAKIDAVKRVYTSLGLSERCNALIDNLLSRATEAIDRIGLSEEAATFFIDFAKMLAGRRS